MIKKFAEYSINENEYYDEEKYKESKKKKIEKNIESFLNQNEIPKNDYELKEFLLKYSNNLLDDFKVDNMIDLIYLLNDNKEMILKLLKGLINQYELENKNKNKLSPSYIVTNSKIKEIEKIYNIIKK